MKRRLFIGSSKEGSDVAKHLEKRLNKEFADFLVCESWIDGKVFSLNEGTLDSLVKASRKFDYGVLVATKDDKCEIRGEIKSVPRDNVMLEIGMFLGSLGLTRAFLLVEDGSKLPSDYNGVTVPYYETDKDGSLDKAIDKIINAIKNTVHSYNLKPVPSAALALGYFDNFIQPLLKKKVRAETEISLKIVLPNNLYQIRGHIENYKLRNPSEEISVYDDGARPRAYHLNADSSQFWDIPTTLQTLEKLINLVNPSSEIGMEVDRKEWIEHEVRNFKGTIEVLVNECPYCKDRVDVVYM